MTDILKQVAAIDVAQDKLDVSLGRINQCLVKEVYAFKTFDNNETGFSALIKWVKKFAGMKIPVRYVMEATGVYHQRLAYYLSDNGCQVSIILPNKIRNFIKSLDIKTITDKTASYGICRFGIDNNPMIWHKPKELFLVLRQLSRERDQLIVERTVAKNQLHAEKAEAFPNKGTIARLNQRIELFQSQEKEIRKEMERLIRQDAELMGKVKKIITIPGVGLLTATIVLAETNGFDLIRSKKQLTSYSGLDVEEKESGTSVKKKPKISKKGNRHLRKAMYMPSLTAIRHDDYFRGLYARLISKHGIKMKAAVAVQRKILELIYTLWKNDSVYDPKYMQNKAEKLLIA